ncbi:MAG: pyrimidine dimer DNA glycosylase/endonuclease V [Nitrosomonas sp.]|nr:MAG: pyrimidine dimer DNA glycosylase/endonuclease V [Nitrosomonas sp.]
MRLWSIHPQYLDAKGLVALWRESLLAQQVLQGKTRGYKNHPQLTRFYSTDNPVAAISCYLRFIADEAKKRNYRFDATKISNTDLIHPLDVTHGQIRYEFSHLLSKLALRDPILYRKLHDAAEIEPHPLFRIVTGDIERWEIVS